MAGANTGESDGLKPPPGVRWRNWTSWTWYQWVSDLVKPCATCLRRHGNVFPYHPSKPHPHCRCEFLAIPPAGSSPMLGATPGGIWRQIPEAGRASLVGEDTLKLIRAGLVTTADVIGDEEIGWLLLAFTELVRRKRLTLEQLTRAGVDEATARRAVDPGAGGR